ncbi:AAA family ATPase [Nonomuraea sp. B12E4]|uniref:helix-turn-helix transcriptional regulator n=1 Tax=Nonomuraea sp. B12E4 TaxID=3153564 RepID=UPI00325CDDD5
MGNRGKDVPEPVSAETESSSWPGWRGRAHEWRSVADLLRAIDTGRGGIVLVEGLSGMGKTQLLHEAAEAAGRAGIAVAHGAADELRRLVPLVPLAAAFDVPALTTPEPACSAEAADLRLSMVERLRALLEERVGRGPMLITLDDLHWADETTQMVLRSLLPELASYPLGWILARTSGIGDPGVDGLYELLEHEGAARVVLGPLDDLAVAEIAADVFGAPPGPDTLETAADAKGNPFLLVELLRACKLAGVVEVTAGSARLTSTAGVRTGACSSLAGLSASTRHLLQVAAILGRSFSVDDLAEMLGDPVDRLLPGLAEALRAGIVMPTADRLTFRHDLLWQIVTDMISEPVRTALQRQAGCMLLQRGAVVPAAALFMRCAKIGDTRALDGLDRAARAVLPYSPQSAMDLAVRALELTSPADGDLLPRTATAVETLTAAGRPAEAIESARAALTRAPPGPWTDRLRCELAYVLLQSGRAAEAVAEAEDLLARRDLGDELRGVAELMVFHGLIGLNDFGRGRARARAVLADRAAHQDTAVVGALLLSAHIAWEEARADDAFRDIHEAVRVASTGSIAARRAHPRLFMVRCLFGVGRYAEAESVIQAAAADFEANGPATHIASPAFFRACLSLATGHPDDAVAEAEAGLKAADEMGAHAYALLGLAVMAIVELRRGNVEAAERHIERLETRQQAVHGPTYGSVWAVWAIALVREAQGGPERAMDALDSCYADVRRRRWMFMLEPNAAAWMTRTALAAGRRSAAEHVAETARQIAHDNPGFPGLAASAAHAHGILHRDVTALTEATTHHSDPWGAASAAEDLGVLLTSGACYGDTKAAIARLEEAADGYLKVGATRDAARTRARLRELGVRRRHWAYAERPSSGWSSLTDTERRVATFVAQGLTNRQVATQMFVSPHTVSFHLRQIFRKLGIASRVELARAAAEQPLHEPSVTDDPRH